MNFFNLILLQIITLELSNMNNNCAVEINRNHSAQAFEDYSVVDTMVQVKVLDYVSPAKRLCRQESERLLSALSSMCTKENTDVCIECGTLKFYCHAVILKARSTMFFRILESSCKPNVVSITEVNPEVMEKIIAFIYSGQVDINKDSLVDVLEAAVKLELPTLLERCHKFFRNQINFENAVDVLLIAEKYGLSQLQEMAEKRITKNRATLMADTAFRQKMMENPRVLLLLYSRLCQDPQEYEERERAGPTLWTCGCGSTVSGQACSWCGAEDERDHSY